LKILGRVWLVWAGLWFAVWFLLLYPFFYLLLQKPITFKYAHGLRKIWGRLASITGFIIPVVKYEVKIPKNSRVVYCPNHMSYLDIVTTGTYLPGFNFFMGKMELTQVPLFNIWFKSLDIPVKRESIKNAHGAFLQASNQMDKLGANLIIFPEGRIPDDTPKIKFPFKPGAFRIAIEKQIPIVPVTLIDNLNRFDSNTFTGSPGIMRMLVHAPIETKGLSIDDVPQLQQKVYDVLSLHLKQHQII